MLSIDVNSSVASFQFGSLADVSFSFACCHRHILARTNHEGIEAPQPDVQAICFFDRIRRFQASRKQTKTWWSQVHQNHIGMELMSVKRIVKRLLQYLGLFEHIRARKLPSGSIVFVHIGKTGGSTLREGINNAQKNHIAAAVHRKKPVYNRRLKYIVAARNPIKRAESAFRYQYKRVVLERSNRGYLGEKAVLEKYGTLNNIAEQLYHDDGSENKEVHKELNRIGHIRTDIAFYLRDLLSRCQPCQIEAVLMQESLNDDIRRVFGYHNTHEVNRNTFVKQSESLTARARSNLAKFLAEDYEALTKLYCWGKIDPETFARAVYPELTESHTGERYGQSA